MTIRTVEGWREQGSRHWAVTAWLGGLRRALESTLGTAAANVRLQAHVPEAEDWAAWPSPVWCRVSAEGLADAVLAGAPQDTAQALGRLAAGDVGPEEVGSGAAFLEWINLSAAAAAAIVSQRTGRRRDFGPAQKTEPPVLAECPAQVAFQLEGVEHTVGLAFDPRWLESVGAGEASAEVTVLPPAAAPQLAAGQSNLDLLMDVELPVVVTFGRTQLPLKDVLRLSSGSIVELNRLVNEPVEVLINNSVIARGEVVVVDGNYGIRVTEVVSRQERIRSIF